MTCGRRARHAGGLGFEVGPVVQRRSWSRCGRPATTPPSSSPRCSTSPLYRLPGHPARRTRAGDPARHAGDHQVSSQVAQLWKGGLPDTPGWLAPRGWRMKLDDRAAVSARSGRGRAASSLGAFIPRPLAEHLLAVPVSSVWWVACKRSVPLHGVRDRGAPRSASMRDRIGECRYSVLHPIRCRRG